MGELVQVNSCCFTGHRPNKLSWGYDETDTRCQQVKTWIYNAVNQAWDDGYRHFICGMAMGCDLYFCEAVLALKQIHPEVQIEAAIPFPGQSRRWPTHQKERWSQLVDQCDYQTVVQPNYDRGCMLRRDRYMVARSTRIIAVFNGTTGGTMQTLAYAMRNGLEVVRMDPDDL